MDTIRVQRANVILDVPSDEKANYMAKGYSVIDVKSGKIIEEAVSNDVATLQVQLKDANEKLASKDAKIKKLEAEITKLKKAQ